MGQGTAMSPHRFAMDRQKEADATASDLLAQTVDSAQSESTPHSDSDSITENTSDLTVSSLYNENVEQLQLEHDLISLDSSQMEEIEVWDTEITYNSLNYLTVPDNRTHRILSKIRRTPPK